MVGSPWPASEQFIISQRPRLAPNSDAVVGDWVVQALVRHCDVEKDLKWLALKIKEAVSSKQRPAHLTM
jgi:hypothetical protein